MAQLALAGSALGPFLGPIGLAAGSLVAGLFFNEKQVLEGPKLGDLRGQTSAYGEPVRLVFGVIKVPANVIWAEDIQEIQHEEDQGGKGGGPETTTKTYTYTASFSGALCAGEVADFRRVWFDSVLVCDFSDTASSATRAASEAFEFDHITFYDGSETETADPVIVAVEGSGAVNGMRGLCRMTVEDLPLEDYGNRRPNVTVEVARDLTVLLDWTETQPGTPTAPPNNVWTLQNLSTRHYLGTEPSSGNGSFWIQREADEALGEYEFDTEYTFRCDIRRESQGATSFRHGYLRVGTAELSSALYKFNLDDGSEISFLDTNGIVSARSVTSLGDGWFRASVTFDSENQSNPSFRLTLRAGGIGSSFPYPTQYNYSSVHSIAVRNPSFATTLGVPYSAFPVCSAIETLCLNAGLNVSDIDCSDIESEGWGFVVSNQTARSAIESLAQAYAFDGVETQGIVKFIERGGASVATIDVEDMAVGFEGDDEQPALTIKRMQELELPRRVSVRYMQRDKVYEQGEQHAQRQTTDAKGELSVDLPLALLDDEAAKIADVLLQAAWAERVSYTFALPMSYYYLDPGDLVTLTQGGESFLARITSISLEQLALLRVEAVRENPSLYSSNWAGVGGPGYDEAVGAGGDTTAVYLDAPMLLDSLNEPRVTFAVDGDSSRWFGARLYQSSDGGTSYDAVSTASSGRLGVTTDALGSASAATWDDTNTVNVDLVNASRTLESRTDLAVLNGANHAAMVHSDGTVEVIAFANATLEGDGTYTLSRLIRGRLGTEHAISGGAIGDDFALLTTTAVGSFPVALSTIGLTRKYKAVSVGQDIADVTGVDYTYNGANLKPYSPVRITGTRDGSNNLTIAWIRRSRFAPQMLQNPILGESWERYEVDIMSGAAVLRTITATTPTVTYTAAEQTADGLTPGDPVEVNIHPMSEAVGRGYAGNNTV